MHLPKIVFEGKEYLAEPGETVLDCLIRQGAQVEYSCQAGVCQTCMLQAVSGDPGPDAQPDLKDALKAQNYFWPAAVFLKTIWKSSGRVMRCCT